MAGSIHDILIRTLGENRDAVASLNEVQRKLAETGSKKEKPEIDLKGATAALAQIATMKHELDGLDRGRFTPEVALRVDRARTDLAAMQRDMTTLRNQLLGMRNSKGPLDEEKLAAGERQLRNFSVELEKIHGKLSEIDRTGGLKFKVDTDAESISRFANHLRLAMEKGLRRIPFVGSILGGIADLGATVANTLAKAIGTGFNLAVEGIGKIPIFGETIANAMTQAAGAMAPFLASVVEAGPAVLALVFALAFLGATITTVVAVLGALVASLTAAVAGAGLLAAAFAAALGPAVLLVFAAVSELVKAFTALHQQEARSTQQAQQVQAGQDSVRAATEQIATAQANLRQQATAAWDAWHQSIQTVKDDLLAVQHAELGIQDAKLRFDEAKQALKDFLTTANAPQLFKKFADVAFNQAQVPSILAGSGTNLGADDQLRLRRMLLDIKDAKLGEADASNTLVKANEKLGQDRKTELSYVQRGIMAYKGYRDAVVAVRRAKEQLGRADLQLARAHDVPSSLGEISPTAIHAAQQLTALWDKVKSIFTPAFGAVVNGIVRGLTSFATILNNKQIAGAITTLGSAIGSALGHLGKYFSDPAWQAAILQFISSSRSLIGPLTSLFESFASIVRDLVRDAMPTLIGMVKDFARNVSAWEKHHGGAKNFHKTVMALIDSFKAWLTILKGLGLILLAFLRGGKKDGDSFAQSLGQMLVHWGRFLNTKKGQEAIHTFFHNAIADAHELWGVLAGILQTINSIITGLKGLNPATWFTGKEPTPSQIHSNPVGSAVQTVVGAVTGGSGDNQTLAHILATQGPQAGLDWLKKHRGHRLGGIATAPTPGVFGESGPEALIPLNTATFSKLGEAIAAAMGAGGGTHIEKVILPPAPAGAVPDARYQASQFAHMLAARGR